MISEKSLEKFSEKLNERNKSCDVMLNEASKLISQVRKMQKENHPNWKGAEQRLIKQAEKYLKLAEKTMNARF